MALQRFARWATALVVVALTVSPTAHADHGPTLLDDRLGTYFGIAQAYWGGPVPTCVENGSALLPVHAVLFDDADPAVAARADQPGCRLWIDRRLWRTLDPSEACMVIVHEWGHLLGRGHVADPNALMAELPVRRPGPCRALDRTARRARAALRRARTGKRKRAHMRERQRRARVLRKIRT